MADELNGTIRTPDQRLRVFVSSTLAELADERAAVAEAISALRLTPVLFELGARPHPPRELYRAYLAQSDIFIGLYWQRYGWMGPDMDISGLEDEFRLSGSLPRLLYVKAPAPEREARLTAMIEQLQNEGTESYRRFSTPDELGHLVRDDLALLLSERFTVAAVSPGAPRRERSLPATSTSLIGRGPDVDEVAKLLETPDVRLVTLTGPGGIGKTRLAVAVGDQLQDRYQHGVTFIPLASISEPRLVMPRVAEAVGASMEGSRPPLDAVIEQIGDTPTLLVLDNLEQVVTVAPELDELLVHCPGLAILATSRTVLRLRAEREYPVDALDVPPRTDHLSAEAVTSCSCVQLFVDRARTVRYDFVLTDDNARAVAEICRRLDGLPLAIEIAAARVRLLEPAALLTRLERGLDALGTGPVDLPERQRTLRATVEWSIELLDEDQRDVLATLSVFVDGWTLDAATQVADLGEDRMLDLLDALAGHSLVKVDATDIGPRFRMLESVRELAAERLAPRADRAGVEQRHAAFFRNLVENAQWPREDESEWAERLRLEEGNVRVAIRWFFDHDISPLPHMFRVLWWFWQLRDRMLEGRAWIEELLRQADVFDDRSRLEVYMTWAVTAIEVGDDEGALLAGGEIERLVGHVDDPFLESWTQLALAWIRPIADDIDGAVQAAHRSLEGFRQLDEPFMTGSALITVGMLEMTKGRLDVALPYLTEVRALGRQFRNSWLSSGAQVQFATLATQDGRFEDAHDLLREALDVAEDVSPLSTHTVSFCLVAFAQLMSAEGLPDRAALALGAAEGVRQRAGIRAWPSLRRGESLLIEHVQRQLGTDRFDEEFANGFQMSRRDAVALVRGDT